MVRGPRTRRPYRQPYDQARTEQLASSVAYFAHRALEPGTHRNRTSAVNSYRDCCDSHEIPSLPFSFKSLGFFAVSFRLRGNKHDSLKGSISHLKNFAATHGLPWIQGHEERKFKEVMKGLSKFNPSSPQRKRPITKKILHAVILAADLSSPKDLQTVTMGLLAHDALLRGRELMHLRIQDVRWDSFIASTTCRITIHGSKCNKTGDPEVVRLKAAGAISAVPFLQRYYQHLQLHTVEPSACLFPLIKLSKGAMVVKWKGRFDKPAFVNAFRALLAAAGISPDKYSGHSFRAGGATDLWEAGCPPEVIKRYGRWKSDCFYIYIRIDPKVVAAEAANYFARL